MSRVLKTLLKNTIWSALKNDLVTAVADEDFANTDQTSSGTLANFPVIPGTLNINDPDGTAEDLVDQGDGTLASATDGGVGTIDYKTGEYTYTFGVAPGVGTDTQADYSYGQFKNPSIKKKGGVFAEGKLYVQMTGIVDEKVYDIEINMEDIPR